jgi:CRP/FNR family cyclic AMP-dependent transcriptional regulator
MTSQPRFTQGWPYAPGRRGARRISSEERTRREQALAQAPLFAGLSKRHLRSIAMVTSVSAYPDGATVVEEGSLGSRFFVLLEGQAKVVRRRRTIARLSPDDFFGEISLLDKGPRTASVIAETPLRCLSLAREDLIDIISNEPRLAVAILRQVAKRLRQSEHPLVD